MCRGPRLAQTLSYLLIFPFQQRVLEQSFCLSSSLYGIFDAGKSAVFITSPKCFESLQRLLPREASVITIPNSYNEDRTLIWFEGHVDETFFTTLPIDRQAILSDTESLTTVQYNLLYQRGRTRLYALEHSVADALYVPADPLLSVTILPSEPINFIPVPQDAVKRVRRLADALRFDSVVASVVNDISVVQMRKDVRWLTGEANDSPIVSRHSFSQGSIMAAKWLKDRFEATGASCRFQTFLAGFAPNVICHYVGSSNTNATVILSAHYDSRGSLRSNRAPGANDDASGVVALLSIAKIISQRYIHFQNNVELVAFAGEEQGFYGSQHYARELRAKNANLILMVQADMLAYRAPGEPPQLGLPDIIGTAEVTSYVASVSSIYSPELVVGATPVCCSDHQSFFEQGFPATQVFERAGPIVDPMYHNSGDLSDRPGYDLDQVRSIAKVQFATLLHAGGYSIGDYKDQTMSPTMS